MSDRIFGGTMLAVAIGFVWIATTFDAGLMADPLGPQTFPIIIGVVLGACSVYIIVRADPEPDWPTLARRAEMGLVIAGLVVYAMVLEPLGFIVSSAIAVWGLGWCLGNRPLPAALTGVSIAVVLYVLFHTVLGLSLPDGVLKAVV